MLDGINTKKYMKKYNKWLKKNGMNIIGNAKYIHHSVLFDGVDYSKITLGNNVVISINCIFLIHDFSIEAGLSSIGEGNIDAEAHFIKDIYIGEGTFIGANCTILGGTRLGKYCIVGAGSVLPGKIYDDYSIVVGNPGKVIGNTMDWAKQKKKEKSYINGSFN